MAMQRHGKSGYASMYIVTTSVSIYYIAALSMNRNEMKTAAKQQCGIESLAPLVVYFIAFP